LSLPFLKNRGKMVHEKILFRDRYRKHKKAFRIFLVLFLILAVIAIIFIAGFMSKNSKNEIILENPLKNIVFANTNVNGEVDYNAVINQGVLEFNQDYILYLLAALGIQNLHKSYIGYGNPLIELQIDTEIWNAEVTNNGISIQNQPANEEDLIISISKQEAVKAILSSNINEFMKESVYNGGTRLEKVAGNIELGSKGYLEMYTQITGEVIAE
jgi:hypothetical protein